MTRQINIHEAKTHLSRLVEEAAKGEEFVIAKAGKPLVKVAALGTPAVPKRLGAFPFWRGKERFLDALVPHYGAAARRGLAVFEAETAGGRTSVRMAGFGASGT